MLTSWPVLLHCNTDLPLFLITDASQYGFGAIIANNMPNGTKKVGHTHREALQNVKMYAHIKKEGLIVIFGFGLINICLVENSLQGGL